MDPELFTLLKTLDWPGKNFTETNALAYFAAASLNV
jgi:hypothetical protein